MGENQTNIRDFESLLQRYSTRTSAGIYGDGSNQKNCPNNLFTPKDVITNVAQTIRAIQNADCIKLDRNARKKLAPYKCSQFLSVNMLPNSKEEPKPPVLANRFETQCVTDTQLIDVIDKAEGLNVEPGMTQEFDTTFFLHGEADSGVGGTKGSNIEINKNQETSSKEFDVNAKEIAVKHTHEHITTETFVCHKPKSNIQQTVDTENPSTSQINKTVQNTETPKDQPVLLTRNKTEILNDSIDIELSLENLGVLIVDTERPASPVLKTNMQTKKPILSQHLVVDLEQFENFEKLAAQLLISERADLNAAENLINSQILGKEMMLLPEFDKQFLEKEPNSRALETKELDHEYLKAEKCVIDEELQASQILMSKGTVPPDLNTKIKEGESPKEKPAPQDRSKKNGNDAISEIEHQTKTQSSTTPVLRPTSVASEDKLEDEILFSSDEEEDYIHKEIQELPLSIALESSFYTNQSDILDRTMYVGFQTASNKSIQISIDSYAKARNAFEQVSLKDLVEKCSENVQIGKNTEDGIEDAVEQNINKISDQNEPINKKIGLKTACSKNFEISKETMLETNTVLKDLNNELSEVFENNTDIQVLPDISDNKKNKVKDIFKDIDLKDIFDTEMGTVQYEENIKAMTSVFECPQFEGFKTASNKNINISIKALERSRKVLKDIDKMDNGGITEVSNPKNDTLKPDSKSPTIFESLNKTTVTKEHDFKGKPEGFRRQAVMTASNEKFKISCEVLPQLNMFLGYPNIEEIHEDVALLDEFKTDCTEIATKNETKENIDSKLMETVQNPAFVGFKTASDKQIDISKQAMTKTMGIFKEIDSVNTTSMKDLTDGSESEEFGVFKISSNKSITISSDPLARTKSVFSKNVFQDIDNINTFSSIEYVEDNAMPTFIGFQTASKKPVVISKDSLEKSKSILEDIDKMSSEKPETCKERVLHGFQTARRKPVAITKKALEKTKYTLLQDIYQAKLPNVCQNLKSEPKFIGFQTASKKPVSISKEAFKKTKHIFQDIDQVKLPINDQNQKPEAMFIGFQTASKKPVSISNEALEKTKNIFQDIDQVKLPTDDQNQKREPTFIGFQVASKNPVSISKALENTKNMFQDIDQVKLPTYGQNQKCEPTFIGCQTASKKPVSISKEALANTKNIFQDIDQVDLPTDDQNQKCEPTFIGFQTASKKPVSISKEALEKTKNIFQDINESNDILREVLKHKSEQQFAGFKTASKKPIFISKEALEKTNSLFRDIRKDDGIEQLQDIKRASNKNVDICKEAIEKTTKWFEELADLRGDSKVNRDYLTPAENPVVKRDNSGNFCGFQTASNRAVKISAEALARTKNIFQDIDLDHKNGEVRKFEGFQTASKKKIRISEDALAKTKNIFDNIENNEAISPKKTNLLGFQTASKKKVEISEDALAKTKDIFKDIELTEKTKPQHPNNNVTRKCNENSFHYKNVLAKIADVKHVKTNSPPINLVQHEHCSEVKEIELDKIVNTQVLQNFEEALNTEDFFPKSPEINRKRSGSPILSCPKAKKRKCFKTPYKITSKIDKPVEASPKSYAKPDNSFKFDVNYKKQKYYTLKIIQQLEKDSKEKAYIDPHITSFKFDDLLQFQFSGDRNNLTTKEILTVEELKNYFEESVNSKIIPIGWFENHVKLILWKLISYEIKFPRTMSNTCNAKTVIDQLKYRYDRELYRVERPALRKILERDDVSTRTIVLCVVSIFADGDNVSSVTNANTTIELLLTDGWYCVQACTDKMLTRLVCERKIFVGCKLMTHGAELLNCEQGVAPWEDTSKVRLKLAGNSTRRARWDQRLGYHGNAAILSPLPTVCPDGGKVAKTRVFVARVYPLLYVEKFEDGSTVTRSERLEQIYQMKYESDRQLQLEKLYEDIIEREFTDVESQDSDPDFGGGKRRCPDSGSQIAKLMRRSKDPQEFRSTLTDSQNRLLADHTANTRERLLQDIQARVQERLARTGLNMTRNVVALLKIRVAGAWEKRGELIVTKGLMSIWRPNDAILEILQEGAWIDVMDVAPTALRYSELQLSAGRQSTFDKAKVKQTEKTKALAKYLVRTCSSIKDLTRNPNSKHDYNEIDTVGMVFEIEPGKEEFEKESIKNHHPFQNVYITDPEKNLLCINFWGGLKKFGFENILDTGQVIVGTNLQKRAGNTRKSIPQFRATEFTYFTKTPRNKTARDMAEEMVKTFLGFDRRKFCQDCIEKKNNMASVKYQSNTETISPYRFNNSDYNLSRNKIYIESPLVQKALQRKDEDLNLTGLDFESTFKHKETQDLSPEELKRKQIVQQKMAKLRMYREPPPISPIHIINKSVHACNEYKSPLVTKPQDSPKTTVYDRNYQNGVGFARLPIESLQSSVEKSGERSCTNITSPMIIMNRTYVKNVNPVKLNFSDSQGVEENNVCVDHFAEEFDDSPPLSLD